MKGLAIIIYAAGLITLYFSNKLNKEYLQKWLRMSYVGSIGESGLGSYKSYENQQKDFAKIFN